METYNKHRLKPFREVTTSSRSLAANGVLTVSESGGIVPATASINSFKNPTYRSQIKNRVNAATPFVGWDTEMGSKSGYAIEKLKYPVNKSPFRKIEGSTIGAPSLNAFSAADDNAIAGLSTVAADRQALIAFTNKHADLITAFQGGVFVGELKEAIKLLRHPAQALRRGVDTYFSLIGKNVKRGTKRSVALRTVSDTWLEWSFGIKPVINDVESALDLLTEPRWAEPRVRTFTVRGQEESFTFGSIASVGPTFPIQDFRRLEILRSEVIYRASFTISPESQVSLRRYGFAPTNWVPTLIELVPYSFLVNYFTDISVIIQALANRSLKPDWVVKTERRVMERQFAYLSTRFSTSSLNPSLAFNFTKKESIPGNTFSRRRQIIRQPYYGSLVPPTGFHLPGSGTRWLNIAALAGSSAKARRVLFNKLI